MAKKTRSAGKAGQTFRIDFANVKLSPAQKQRLTVSIEKTVLTELAELDLGPTVGIGRIRREWLGLWIIDRFRGLQGSNVPRELTGGGRG